MKVAKKIIITGRVQAVGFRPFIFRLADKYKIKGEVFNALGIVEIIAEGEIENISLFIREIIENPPPLARPILKSQSELENRNFTEFKIVDSRIEGAADIFIPPDLFMCNDCQREVEDPSQRRYNYAFTNCTQCGPRYTIIKSMPYDRANTTMADFPLCPQCQAEYENPLDRRFHAEPLACKTCGPQLEYIENGDISFSNDDAVDRCIQAIKAGKIVAIKGVGGYHIVCDAKNKNAVANLRNRKNRPHKPLAIMFPLQGVDGLEIVRHYCDLSTFEAQAIISNERPIVLVRAKVNCELEKNIAPNLGEIGVFVPYSPLYHILLKKFNAPLVATSGNISGEPVIIDNLMANEKLGTIVDGFLHHNRPILRPADDSVLREIDGKMRIIRAGRGLGPVEIELGHYLQKPILATGGHMKNTLCIGFGARAIISPHIGDLETARSREIFGNVANDLPQLFSTTPEIIAHDANASYASSKWAKTQAMRAIPIQHHMAHASGLAFEFKEIDNWMMIVWDGIGLGKDNELWGGETFFGNIGNWQRIASLRPFRLLGGDKAARQIWRSLAALLWESEIAYESESANRIALQAWQRNINCFQTTSIGRLFDAASCAILGREYSSFEGQGPMELEAICDTNLLGANLPKIVNNSSQNLLLGNWNPILDYLCDGELSKAQRATGFHEILANWVIDQFEINQSRYNIDAIGLCGGVFQNRFLTELIIHLGRLKGIKILINEKIPTNDGGLSFGQLIEASEILLREQNNERF